MEYKIKAELAVYGMFVYYFVAAYGSDKIQKRGLFPRSFYCILPRKLHRVLFLFFDIRPRIKFDIVQAGICYIGIVVSLIYLFGAKLFGYPVVEEIPYIFFVAAQFVLMVQVVVITDLTIRTELGLLNRIFFRFFQFVFILLSVIVALLTIGTIAMCFL